MTASTPQPQLRFVPGLPPETVEGWPGMDYSETTDAGMRIERNVKCQCATASCCASTSTVPNTPTDRCRC